MLRFWSVRSQARGEQSHLKDDRNLFPLGCSCKMIVAPVIGKELCDWITASASFCSEQSLVLCMEFPPNVLEEFLRDLLESWSEREVSEQPGDRLPQQIFLTTRTTNSRPAETKLTVTQMNGSRVLLSFWTASETNWLSCLFSRWETRVWIVCGRNGNRSLDHPLLGSTILS